MITNQQVLEGFAKIYSQMTDDELLGLSVEWDTFFAQAYWALLAELQKRSVSESSVALAERKVAVKTGRSFSEGEDEELFCGAFGRR